MLTTNVIRPFGVPSEIGRLNEEARSKGHLPAWVIFWDTKDFPGEYVARLFIMAPEGGGATPHLVRFLDHRAVCMRGLHELQTLFWDQGMQQVSRAPSDDSVIVETWI